ncbi:HEAT repeat domain-containing protein [Kineosporia sp. R_H_3]|uniref:HEAT repeat domain-containing protein n=1 Tax=Kineosporia sp. R_H_3 TaxID=1961848 RepID=UPI00117B2471|nr:HEAT repeat domain-containing protein [Kineosporia sp. R_H_3]
MSPGLRVAAACERHGTDVVVRACLEVLAGREAEPEIVEALGGDHARQLLAQGVPEVHAYWLRVWGARGLLYAWPTAQGPDVDDALAAATTDPHWRVREMVCKVVAKRERGDVLEAVLPLRDDPVERVRRAAGRAVVRVTAAGG